MSVNTVWTVTRTQARTGLPMIAGYWAIMGTVYAGIIATVLLVGDADVSIWATSGGSAPKYFLMVIGIMLTTAYLPIYVGNGVTRRDFARAASLYIVAVAAVYAVLMTLGYVVEYNLYSAGDLFGGLKDPYPMRSFADAWSIFVAELFVGAAYLCVGWLLGTCFYRLGTWWGIGLIPLTLVPAVVTEVGFDSLWAGYGINNGLGIEPPPLAIGVLIASAAVAVAWIVNFALIRAVAIKKVSG